MYRFTTTVMIFALALGFQSAYAAPPESVPSIVVHFADLDLSRSEGAAVLYQRLNGAAETVCAPLDGRHLGRHMSSRRVCKPPSARRWQRSTGARSPHTTKRRRIHATQQFRSR